MSFKTGDDGSAGERKVAYRVQYLVTHELIGKPHAFAVEKRVAIDSQCVLKRGAAAEPGLVQSVDLANEAERPGGRDIGPEALGRKPPEEMLPANRGGRKIDLEIERAIRTWPKGGHGPIVADLDAPENFDGLAVMRRLRNAGPVDQLKITQRISVEDRRLWPVNRDLQIVDFGAGNRCHQVLNDADARFILRDNGAEAGLSDIVVTRMDRATAEICAPKHDPGARCRGRKCH